MFLIKLYPLGIFEYIQVELIEISSTLYHFLYRVKAIYLAYKINFTICALLNKYSPYFILQKTIKQFLPSLYLFVYVSFLAEIYALSATDVLTKDFKNLSLHQLKFFEQKRKVWEYGHLLTFHCKI